jgi:selenocysteine lyase/cysteine desulfurase
MRWANELKKESRVKIHSSLEPGQTWGLAVVSIDGVDSSKLVTHLWDKHRIVIVAVGHENPKEPSMTYRGLRVTPNIYTPLEEIDTFVEAMRKIARNGLEA